MIIVRDIPQVKLREAVFALLKNSQTHDVYGVVPDKAKLPYMVIGATTFKPDASKNSLGWDASVTIHCWSATKDMATCNEMMADAASIITGLYNTAQVDGYQIIDCELDLAEGHEEDEYSFHGVLTFLFKLQKE